MDNSFTVSGIAELLAAGTKPADVARLIRQLRHWTMIGILEPVGQTFSGAGRHRRYSSESVHMAAVLVELNRYQLGLGVLRSVGELLRQFAHDPKWSAAKTGKKDIILVLETEFLLDVTKQEGARAAEAKEDAWEPREYVGGLFERSELHSMQWVLDLNSAVVLNLTKIFGRLK